MCWKHSTSPLHSFNGCDYYKRLLSRANLKWELFECSEVNACGNWVEKGTAHQHQNYVYSPLLWVCVRSQAFRELG